MIVTASVEVMKQGLIKFEPPLPDEKICAFNKTVLANYVKVFVKWDRRWWGT